jgi:hypothetical protein
MRVTRLDNHLVQHQSLDNSEYNSELLSMNILSHFANTPPTLR